MKEDRQLKPEDNLFRFIPGTPGPKIAGVKTQERSQFGILTAIIRHQASGRVPDPVPIEQSRDLGYTPARKQRGYQSDIDSLSNETVRARKAEKNRRSFPFASDLGPNLGEEYYGFGE